MIKVKNDNKERVKMPKNELRMIPQKTTNTDHLTGCMYNGTGRVQMKQLQLHIMTLVTLHL